MTSCCSFPSDIATACPSCGQIGPIVGSAPVRPHRPAAADGAWQYCATSDCRAVYYLGAAIIDVDAVITQVAGKATDRPLPVCFCFAHTADAIIADAEAHGGTSTISESVKQSVAEGLCACTHLNPSTKCCLPDVHRMLRTNSRIPLSSKAAVSKPSAS